jgi:hypothetical protein
MAESAVLARSSEFAPSIQQEAASKIIDKSWTEGSQNMPSNQVFTLAVLHTVKLPPPLKIEAM